MTFIVETEPFAETVEESDDLNLGVPSSDAGDRFYERAMIEIREAEIAGERDTAALRLT